MKTTEIELRSEEGKSFLETNQFILEQCAVQAILELMNSAQSPDIKLAASIAALKAIGKAEPKQVAPSNTTNIQINTAIAGEAGKALAGLAGALKLMSVNPQSELNAPQTPLVTAEEAPNG